MYEQAIDDIFDELVAEYGGGDEDFADVISPPELGTITRLEYEINRIVQDPAEAKRWGVAGSLADRLEIRRFMSSAAWTSNVRFRPSDFKGNNKCNLFALDIAWRCGFCVPLLYDTFGGTSYRYGFPLANSLTSSAERALNNGDEELRGTDDGSLWGWVETNRSATEINNDIDTGWIYILVGWRRTGTGHVGIIRRIVNKKDDTGRIQDITYQGWEAISTKAKWFNAQRWRTTQCGQTNKCDNNPPDSRFCAIHIICLNWERDPARRGVKVGHIDKCKLS